MAFALITGSGKGIGQAIAFELAKRNIDVLLTARSAENLQKTSEAIKASYKVKAEYLPLDLSEPQAPQKLYNWCIQNNYDVRYLINNAGFGLSGSFSQIPLEQSLNLIQLNVVAVTQLCHIFLPLLKKQPQSYILNIASTSAYQSVPMLSVYSATKSFVLSFSRGLHHELKDKGVSVTCVSPGPTDTEWSNRANIKGKALKMADKVNMTSPQVAKIAVEAMLSKKTEVVTGMVNKLGVFMAWLLPKALVEKSAHNLYK
jgi:uncharacterized protein